MIKKSGAMFMPILELGTLRHIVRFGLALPKVVSTWEYLIFQPYGYPG